MAINIDIKRRNLVNKRNSHPITDEELKFYLTFGPQPTALLKEGIDPEQTNSVIVTKNGITQTAGTDYYLNTEASTIELLGDSPDTTGWVASYYGVGSIIWAEDVNDLQSAASIIAASALDKSGDTMTGTLNMGNNIITNVNTVDGVDISAHNHTNGQGGLIGTNSIINDAITTEKIATNAITTAKIQDNNVTDAKIESVSVNKVTGLTNQFANKYLTNLTNGLENTICTDVPTTSATATLQKPVVIADTRKNADNSWYKLYSNGWIEMGGLETVSSNSSKAITFPNSIILKETSYNVQLTPGATSYNSKTVSGFTITSSSFSGEVSWKVEGIASGKARNLLYQNYNIGNGANTVNILYTETMPANATLEIELAGSDGYWYNPHGPDYAFRSPSIKCNMSINAGESVIVKSINCAYPKIFSGHMPGIAVALYKDSTLILVGGAGGWEQYDAPAVRVGGSGFEGGSVYSGGTLPKYPGYSIDGNPGNYVKSSLDMLSGANVSDAGTTFSYGGEGYIRHSDLTNIDITGGSDVGIRDGIGRNAYISIYSIV